MIEKLKEHDVIDPKTDKVIGKIGCDLREIMDKLNEVVDAVNEIMTWRFETDEESPAENVQPDAETRPENVQDKFAEQRKWIGKLCRFRDNPACEWKYGILEKIYEDADFPFWDTDCYEYAECELVKPDADIIYKGGDNE